MSTTSFDVPRSSSYGDSGRDSGSGRVPAGQRPPDRLPVPRRKRQPALAAVAILLVAGCMAVFGSVVVGSNHHVPVLKLVRGVNVGQIITAEDLGVANISGSGVIGFSTSIENLVVGDVATADLPAGTILVKGMISRSAPVPAPGQQVVGVALKPGTVPLDQLTPGRDVTVIEVPAASQQQLPGAVDPFAASGYVIVPSALVLSVSSDPTSGATLVSLVVTDAQAAPVVRAGVQNMISLALLPVTQ